MRRHITPITWSVRGDREVITAQNLTKVHPDFFAVYDRLTASEYLDFYASAFGRSAFFDFWRARMRPL
jgi:hypothetical protein